MTEQPAPKPPHGQLMDTATAHWVSRIVYAAARLELADHLAAAVSVVEAVPVYGTQADNLSRK